MWSIGYWRNHPLKESNIWGSHKAKVWQPGQIKRQDRIIFSILTWLFINNKLNCTYTNIADCDFSKSIGKYVFGFFGRAITNIWHPNLAFETPSNSVIYTSRFSPVWLQNKNKKWVYTIHENDFLKITYIKQNWNTIQLNQFHWISQYSYKIERVFYFSSNNIFIKSDTWCFFFF